MTGERQDPSEQYIEAVASAIIPGTLQFHEGSDRRDLRSPFVSYEVNVAIGASASSFAAYGHFLGEHFGSGGPYAHFRNDYQSEINAIHEFYDPARSINGNPLGDRYQLSLGPGSQSGRLKITLRSVYPNQTGGTDMLRAYHAALQRSSQQAPKQQ